jgi:hypothetical protein
MSHHKLYGFAHSANPVITQYMEEQLNAILKQDPTLEIELADENNELLPKYSKTPNRLPCLMLFKNDSCKNYIHAKLSNDEAYSWFISKRG